jgi:hypothetical protein
MSRTAFDGRMGVWAVCMRRCCILYVGVYERAVLPASDCSGGGRYAWAATGVMLHHAGNVFLYERGRYAWAATGVMLHHAGNVGEQHDSWQYAAAGLLYGLSEWRWRAQGWRA